MRNFWQKKKKIKAGALTIEQDSCRAARWEHLSCEHWNCSPKTEAPGRVGGVAAGPKCAHPKRAHPMVWQQVFDTGLAVVWQPLAITMFWYKSRTYLLSLNSQNIYFLLATSFYRAWCWCILWKSVKLERNGTQIRKMKNSFWYIICWIMEL